MSFTNRLRSLVLLIALVLLAAPTLLAQGQAVSARLSGTVTDSAGAVIPGASVSLSNSATGLNRQFTTSESGQYSFPLIPPGKYELKAEKTGFDVAVHQNIVLEVGQDSTLNVSLNVGKVSQTMTVQASAVQLETGNANISSDVNSKLAVDLPLNQRNPFGLVLLDSSVNNSSQTQVLNGPGSQGGVDQDVSFFNFGGGRFGSTEFLLDGNWNGAGDWDGIIFVPTVDELEEDKIQTTTFSPQFGWSMGNVVNAITKSGTSSLHGDAYEFLRNSDLDANNFFNNASGIPRPGFRRNQFGFTVGGPVYIPGLYRQRDKTFFFAAFEGLRQQTPATSLSTVPTTAERGGDFSALSSTIYNPFTTTFVNGNPVRQAFAGNMIPTSLINPVAAKLLSYYPTPNLPGLSNNYIYSAGLPLTGTQYTVRIDRNITDTQHLYGRWSQKPDNNKVENAPYLGASNIAGPGLSTHNPRYNGSLGYTNTFSPTFILSMSAGYGHWAEIGIGQGAGFTPSTLGLPASLNNFLGALGGFPQVTVAGYTALGSAAYAANVRTSASFSVDVTKILGPHTVTTGFDYIYLPANSTNSSSPVFGFGTDFTSNPGNSAGTGNALASLLLGTADSGSISLSASTAESKKYLGWYLNDEWKLTKKLTVNLGLRYEIQTAPTERYNRLTSWLPNAINPISSQVGSTLLGAVGYVNTDGLSRGAYDTNYLNVAPRISLSYSPTEKLVFRSGFGIFYVPSTPLGAPIGPGYSPSTSYVGSLNGYTPLTTISNPYPNGYVLPTGTSLGGLTDVGQGVTTTSRIQPTPYISQWSAGIQYQLTSSTIVQADYVGNHGVKLDGGNFQLDQLNPQYLPMGNALLNQVPNPFYGHVAVGALASPTVSQATLLEPYPQFAGSVNLYDSPWAQSWYEALKLTGKHRFSDGLQFLVSYTWSKYLDTSNGDQSWASRAQSPRNWYDTSLDKSLDENDIPNSLVVSYTYELPVGKGKRIQPPKYLNAVIGGWQVSGISTFKSGFPLEIASDAPGTTLFGGSPRANFVGNPRPAHQTIYDWVNPAAFAFPAPFTFGNTPRTLGSVRSPGTDNTDATLMKNFQLWNETSRLQFRAEFYNLFNQANFYAPDSTVGDTNFGVINAAFPGRSIQFGIKLYW